MVGSAKNMEHPAIMPGQRVEVPHLRSPRGLVGGEFDRAVDYTNWRPRGSGDWLLIHTVEGAGRVGLPDGRSFTVTPGDELLYAPDAVQDYSTDPGTGRWRLLWTHFEPRPHWRPWLQWPRAAPGIGRLRIDAADAWAETEAALRRMLAVSHRSIPTAVELAFCALEDALLWIHGATPDTPWGRLDPRIRRVMDYLAARPAEPFHLEALARHCGLSPSRLGHLFKAELNVTPQQYAEELRLEQAKRLLAHTGLAVREVATATGFGDALYFSKRFRRHAGSSPRQWRNREEAVSRPPPSPLV